MGICPFTKLIVFCVNYYCVLRYLEILCGDDIDNTVEPNSSIFSLIWIC